MLLKTIHMGDFNCDGRVDGTDFLVWQRGESPDSLSTSDLADWEANFGTIFQLSEPSIIVPEPASMLLLILVLVVFLGCQLRNANISE